MPGDGEAELLMHLTKFVDAWTSVNGRESVDHAVVGARPDDLVGESPELVRPGGLLSPAQVSSLLAMGYLESRQPAGALVPTTEALSLTDPWLCPELATSIQAAFHDGFLRCRAEAHGA